MNDKSKNAITSYKFLSGGNAVFTVSNPQGVHYSFRISQPNEKSPFFASLMGGEGAGQHRFQYMGIFDPQQAQVITTRKSQFAREAVQLRVLRWAVARLAKGEPMPEGYGIQHDGKCCCCGRQLTTPESLEAGLGPECAKHFTL